MISQRYCEKKTAVLDVWNRYRSIRGTTEDGVNPAFMEPRAKAWANDQIMSKGT